MTTEPSNLGKPSSLDALTGLRFVAAMTVVLVHGLKLTQAHTETGPWAANSVTFFFVLSGFILTYVYAERMKTIGAMKFYVARFARIWPLHIFCLLVMLWVRGLIFGKLPLNFDFALLAHTGLVQSWFLAEQLPMQFNGLAWSISTELGFYLLFPFILLLARKRFLPVLLANIVLLAIAMAVLDTLCERGAIDLLVARVFVYVNPLIRLLDFVAGMFTAKLFLHSRPRNLGDVNQSDKQPILHTVTELFVLSFAVATIYLVNFTSLREFMNSVRLPTTFAWLSRGGACLLPFCLIIWVFSWSRGWLARLLSTRLMVYLGEVSFALYLIQLSVFYLLNQQVSHLNWPASLYLTVSVAASLSAAMFAHAVVEEPCRQFFVSLWDRDWSRCFRSLLLGYKNLRRHHTGLIAGLILLMCFGAVKFEQRYGEVNIPTRELLRMTNDLVDVEFEPVTFEREATLHWLKVDDRGDQVVVTMWWELLEGHQRARVMHFIDGQGKILCACHRNDADFLINPPGTIVPETITIDKKELTSNVKQIGIGLWLEGLGGAQADRGQTQMNRRRLVIAEVTEDGVVGVDETNVYSYTGTETDSKPSGSTFKSPKVSKEQ